MCALRHSKGRAPRRAPGLRRVSGRAPARARLQAFGSLVDETRLRNALAQLVEVLSWLHELGRVHRDVNPDNVLVSEEGRVVLLDFGVMTATGREGDMMGTPAFMAPEQLGGGSVGPAADWYAVGGMLFAALTGPRSREIFSSSSTQRRARRRLPRPTNAWQMSPPTSTLFASRSCSESRRSDRT